MYRQNPVLSISPKDAMVALFKSRGVRSWTCRSWLRRVLAEETVAGVGDDHDIRKAMSLLMALGFTRAQLVAAYDELEIERPKADWS